MNIFAYRHFGRIAILLLPVALAVGLMTLFTFAAQAMPPPQPTLPHRIGGNFNYVNTPGETLTTVVKIMANGDEVYSFTVTTTGTDVTKYGPIDVPSQADAPPEGRADTGDTISFEIDGGVITQTFVFQRGKVEELNLSATLTPVAIDDSRSVNEDEVLSAASVLANDRGIGGATVTATLESSVSNGSIAFSPDGTFTYTPTADFSGSDNFSYSVSDGSATSNTALVTITVNPVPDPILSVMTTASDDTPDAGESITYTVVISNGGDGAAGDVSLQAVLADGVEFVEGSASIIGAKGGSTGNEPSIVTDLFVGAGRLVTVTFRVDVVTVTVGAELSSTIRVLNEGSISAESEPTITVQAPENSFRISDASVSEGTGGSTALNFTVSRSDNTVASSVAVSTQDGTAIDASDYTELSDETVSFTAGGDLTQTVSISVAADSIVESDETLTARLSDPTNGSITDASGRGTIINDDSATISISNGEVRVNDVLIDEPYIKDPSPNNQTWTVTEDHFFVMGDNRRNSSDSRSWSFLPEDDIIGQAWVVYWPPKDWQLVPHFDHDNVPEPIGIN